jgi:hypothetical protein
MQSGTQPQPDATTRRPPVLGGYPTPAANVCKSEAKYTWLTPVMAPTVLTIGDHGNVSVYNAGAQ